MFSRVARSANLRLLDRADHRSAPAAVSPSANCTAGVVENRADGGSVIVINPRTGEILGDGQRAGRSTRTPHRDAPKPGEETAPFRILRAGLDVQTRDGVGRDRRQGHAGRCLIDTSPGYITVDSGTVRDTVESRQFSFRRRNRQIRATSARIKIGLRVGRRTPRRYVNQASGSAVPCRGIFQARVQGIVWDWSKWTEGALAHVAIGYQVGVTPLQMLAAVSSIANGGEYLEPRIVRAAYREGPALRRRAEGRPPLCVSADTAATLTGIMAGVVEHGTGTPAQIKGFTIAGKTGTCGQTEQRRRTHSPITTRRLSASCRRAIPQMRDHRRHRFAARAPPLFRRAGLGADLQTHRGSVAEISRGRADRGPGPAGDDRAAPRRRSAADCECRGLCHR